MFQRGGSVKATEEVWENQMYIPVRGWGSSFTFESYTDKTCAKTLSTDQFPNIAWEWTTEWTVDTSNCFGSVDGEGWCYATTLDKLIASVISKSSSSENHSSCMVRRRRWIRERACVSDDAMKQHQERIEYLMTSRSRMETALTKKKDDFEAVMSFEEKRAKEFAAIVARNFSGMVDSVDEFHKYAAKLDSIREMLVRQARIDKEYAVMLEQISLDFAPDKTGEGTVELRNQRARVDSGEDSSFMNVPKETAPPLTDDCALLMGADCLLGSVSESNAISASLWRDFSSMIGESMIQDVEEARESVAAVLQAMNDLAAIREKMRPWEARIAFAVASLKTAYGVSTRKLQTLMADMELDISGGTRLTDGTGDGRSTDELEDKDGNREGQAEVGGSKPSSSDTDTADMWLHIRAYKTSVVELSHVIQLLHIRESKLREMKKSVVQRLKLLFVATMQLFVHERARTYNDSAEFLQRKKEEVMSLKLGSSSISQIRDTEKMKSEPSDEAVEVASPGKDEAAAAPTRAERPSVPTDGTTATALPNGNGQILMQSIMQITTLENANRIQSFGKEKPERRSSFLGGMLSGSSPDVAMSDLMSAKVVATTDGMLHVFLLEGAGQSSSKEKTSDKPYLSLVLEGCRIVQQADAARSGVLDHSMEMHPKPTSTGLLSSKKDDSIVLVPLSDEEASAWLAIFCDPICGASLLVPLLSGAKIPERRSSMSSLDAAFSGSSAAKVEELFVTVPPESLKSRRKSVTTTGVTSTPVDPFAQTTSVVEQSNAAIEQAREMMRTAEEVPDSATGDEDAEKTEEGEDLDLRESVDLDDCNTATL